MADAYRSKGFSSALSYQDPKAAFRWLESAFGFEPMFVILDADGNLAHSEMSYGDSVVMIGSEWSDEHKSPRSAGGKNTQSVHVQLAEGEDIDAHCEHARAAGRRLSRSRRRSFTATGPIARKIPKGISGPSALPCGR